MGQLKNVIFDIQDELEAGDLSFAEIALRYDVPQSTVEEILQDMIEQEVADYDGQPTEHEEWMSFDADC